MYHNETFQNKTFQIKKNISKKNIYIMRHTETEDIKIQNRLKPKN